MNELDKVISMVLTEYNLSALSSEVIEFIKKCLAEGMTIKQAFEAVKNRSLSLGLEQALSPYDDFF